MKQVRNLILSFFVAYAWMNIGGLESTNILLLCVFASSYIVLLYRDELVSKDRDHKKIRIASYSLSALFAILYALFDDLSGGLENRLFIAVFVTCSVIGLFVMFQALLEILITKAVRAFNEKKNLTSNAFSLKILFTYAAIVFVCCIPFLALNYPGVMTPDSLSQLRQAIGTEEYVNHHPWIHTALIRLFYNIGYFFTKDMYSGIFSYTLFQILMVSLSIGYVIECMYESGVKKSTRICLLLTFILLPYNLMYAVTIWKDVLFSMSVLVFTVTVMRICIRARKEHDKDDKKDSLRDAVMFVICGFFMCVLRHNGYYAFIATVVIWLFLMRKELKRYIIMSLLVIVAASLCRGPLMRACHVQKDDYVFNLCIPLQQIGRVIVDNEQMSDEQIKWLESVNSFEYIRAGYSTQGADTMTAWVVDGDKQFFDSHKSEFFGLWAQIGIEHPVTYIKAYIDLTMGYWAPMNPQQTVNFGITKNGMDLYERPIISGPVLIKINELLTKLYSMIPIYGQFYCMGGFLWLMLTFAAICICSKRADKLYPYLPVFMLTMTLLLATPLVADLRYAYALMLTLPYIAVYSFNND